MQQTEVKGIPDLAWLSGKGEPLVIVQAIKIWPFLQLVYAQTRISPENETHKNSLGFWDPG